MKNFTPNQILEFIFFIAGLFCILSLGYLLKPNLTAENMESFGYAWMTSFGVMLLSAMISPIFED